MVKGHDFKKFPELTNNQMALNYFASPHKQITEDFRAKVIKVTDGDTVRVLWDKRDFTFPIRMLDIAAPELNERGGEDAQKWLESEILGKNVEIEIDMNNRVEKWGRLLGRIIFKGINMSEEEIRNGFAVSWENRKQTVFPNFNAELEEFER